MLQGRNGNGERAADAAPPSGRLLLYSDLEDLLWPKHLLL